MDDSGVSHLFFSPHSSPSFSSTSVAPNSCNNADDVDAMLELGSTTKKYKFKRGGGERRRGGDRKSDSCGRDKGKSLGFAVGNYSSTAITSIDMDKDRGDNRPGDRFCARDRSQDNNYNINSKSFSNMFNIFSWFSSTGYHHPHQQQQEQEQHQQRSGFVRNLLLLNRRKHELLSTRDGDADVDGDWTCSSDEEEKN